jgi:hypothetical protein
LKLLREEEGWVSGGGRPSGLLGRNEIWKKEEEEGEGGRKKEGGGRKKEGKRM